MSSPATKSALQDVAAVLLGAGWGGPSTRDRLHAAMKKQQSRSSEKKAKTDLIVHSVIAVACVAATVSVQLPWVATHLADSLILKDIRYAVYGATLIELMMFQFKVVQFVVDRANAHWLATD